MAGILDLLGNKNVQQIIQGVSGETGISQSQASSVINMALPLLMGAMQKNSSDSQGAAGLLSALQSSKHDGSLLDNLGGLFSGGVNSAVTTDGVGILGHLLGGSNTSTVSNAISNKTGVSSANVTKILAVLAPILMSYLGKQVTSNKVSNSSGLGSLLNSTLGSNQGGSMLTSLLDSNGDGSILDDVAGLVLGGGNSTQKKGGLGGLLGGLFGGK
ncbi:MAG: DUF937 domain-containing protein [Capnocytophaga sp.]|nr:DUF937 domain-containing protein [Capnocytophaga sp.]